MDNRSSPTTILTLLVEQAEVRAQAPAMVVAGRHALTFAALLKEVDRTANALAGMGIGIEARVALALPSGPETAVLSLAVMACAGCVPLNPALDRPTCELLLRALNVDVLVAPHGVDSDAITVARTLGLPVLRLASRGDAAAGAFELHGDPLRAPVPRTRPTPEDLALLLHTSGTTATPKAVPLTHLQMLARSRSQPIDDHDVCLCVAPLFTGSAIGHSLLAPLAEGAAIGFARNSGPGAIVDALRDLGATCFSASPTVLSSLLEALDQGRLTVPATLRYVRSSSSALPAVLWNRLEGALGVPVIQGFGSTEGGTIAQNPLPPGRRKPGSVGLPVGPEIAILDDEGNRCAALGVGAVNVRGPGVMSGYANDPDANRLAFHDGWFRTGDLGYLDEDGYLYLTGRLKEMINRGGLKISPTEVDEALQHHPDVREVATFAVAHPTLGEDVAVAVVLRENSKATAGELREFALERLAPHKVPTTVLQVKALARNALGKINRGALARELKDALRHDFVLPRTPGEEQVAGVFADVLHVDRIGAFDNFFALGGDSLSGMKVVAKVNALYGLNLNADMLFRRPTVCEFAAMLTAMPEARQKSWPAIAARHRVRQRGKAVATRRK